MTFVRLANHPVEGTRPVLRPGGDVKRRTVHRKTNQRIHGAMLAGKSGYAAGD